MRIFKSLKNHKGFTLVELAIVLVIIGIILGAVLKGQELINSAKIKRAYNQQREIVAAVYSYYDKYGKFPGDDNTAATRGGVWAGTANGNGDGMLGGAFQYNCAVGSAQESCVVWQHLRLSNIISGSGRTNPQHAFGGAISVAYVNAGAPVGAANWISFQNVPRDVAQIIDTQYDDGVWNTGSIQGSADYTIAGAPILLYSRL
jgi:prepilin-type N-terminal cleavage/methylation domain-containing protein